jgi:Secretion system C-terminal sorting domain
MKKIFTLLLVVCFAIAANAQVQFINDPSLEQFGIGDSTWLSDNNQGVGNLVDYSSTAHSGNYVGLFITYPGSQNQNYFAQYFANLKVRYNCKLEFYIRNVQCSGSSTDVFFVTLQGFDTTGPKELFSITGLKGDSAAIGTAWKKITVNIDTLNSGVGLLYFQSLSLGFATSYSWYEVDDITLTSGYPTAINEVSAHQAMISPTLFNNTIQMDFSNASYAEATLQLNNINGQKVLNKKVSAADHSINTSDLQTGIYFATLLDDNGTILNRTTLQKQ